MPTIPRYQARGGPSVGGLNYAGAYSPPDGSDWRTLARTAEAAGTVLNLFQQIPKPAARDAGPEGPQAPPDGPAAPTVEDHLLGKAGDVSWRRNHLTADIDAVDPEVVRQSRQQVAEALQPGARKVFDMLTVPREGGFMAAVAARAGERVREASRAVSLERQALGVDEYHALIETAPEQAMAALGSASGELAARLREGGAGEAEIQTAQRELVSSVQAERVSRALDSDPDQAAVLLNEASAIGEADRQRLAEEIEAEQLRRGVQREVGRWVADDPSLAEDPERLMALAQGAGEGDAHLGALYHGSALSEMRAARARTADREAQAWAPVEALLAEGRVRSWTDLPTRLWRNLSPGQQADLRTLTGQGADGGEAGPEDEPDRWANPQRNGPYGEYLFKIADMPPAPRDQVSPYPRSGGRAPLAGGDRLPPGRGFRTDMRPDPRVSPPLAPNSNINLTGWNNPPAPHDRPIKSLGDAVGLINSYFAQSKNYDLDRLNNYIWDMERTGFGHALKIVRLPNADIADEPAKTGMIGNLKIQIFRIPGAGPPSYRNLLLSVEYPTNASNPAANGKWLVRFRETEKGIVTELWDGTTEFKDYFSFNPAWRTVPAGMNPRRFDSSPFKRILEAYIAHGYIPEAKRVPDILLPPR